MAIRDSLFLVSVGLSPLTAATLHSGFSNCTGACLGVVRPMPDQFQSVGVGGAGLAGLGNGCWYIEGKFGVGRLGE